MAVTLPVLTLVPTAPYRFVLWDPTDKAEFDGSPYTSEASRLSRGLNRWDFSVRKNDAALATLLTFWKARRGPAGLFYWRPGKEAEYARTAIVPTGAINGVNKVYTIPVGDPNGGDYPIDDANAILKVNGVAVAKTVDTDGRTMTATVAPAGGTTVTMDYYRYARVRFDGDRFDVQHRVPGENIVPLLLTEQVT